MLTTSSGLLVAIGGDTVSEKEKVAIMEALSALPEEKKQFVLGYAAGIAAKASDKAKDSDEHDNDKKKEA